MNRTHFTDRELDFLTRMRVGRLATADAAGQPHVVPVVFATDGRNIYTPLDEKPKRVQPRELKRVRNLFENPKVAFIVDHYEEEWTQLSWLLVRGTGTLVENGEAHVTGVRLLQKKYAQYEKMSLKDRPLIVIAPSDVTSWKPLQE
ncbi:MAG: TIGR03668 family PPOX class F420-dependent oxidoreductase [Acidobacteria bacterium]|nr:MAG: TIGR03668 family PPOX class F420-dependent oxidoreductase [Acidobacteriota bacterium]